MKRRLDLDPSLGISRRDALGYLAAMGAAVALPACRRPVEKILPYVRQPEEIVPGNPLHFATALPLMGTAFGVVVESHEGRPTKIEGNPLHPESLGGTSSFAQAAVLDLYDPDRSRSPRERGTTRSWQEAEDMLSKVEQSLASDKGGSLAIITDAHRSPTFQAAIRAVTTKYPEVLVVKTEPLSRAPIYEALSWLFGRALEPIYDISRADVVVSLDADFLGLEDSPVRAALEWSARRDPEHGPLNRLYVFESAMTVTGASADHRFACPFQEVFGLLARLANALRARGIVLGDRVTAIAARLNAASPVPERVIEHIAKELFEHQSRSLVIAGARQPAAVHALAQALNFALGNANKTVRYVQPFDASPKNAASLEQLNKAVKGGNIRTLLTFGINPVCDAPGDVDFPALIRQIPLSIHVGTHFDETAALATWHLNRSHTLESWGDVVARDGTASIMQPLIAPLFDGRTDPTILLRMLGKHSSDYECVRETWLKVWGNAGFEERWRTSLRDGVVADSALPSAIVEPRPLSIESLTIPVPRLTPFELVFTPSVHTYDGRFANNPWLLELPEPITKVTWNNPAWISRRAAERLGLADGDLIDVATSTHTVRVPVVVVPGQAENTITVSLGFGRSSGVSPRHRTGVNVNPLRLSSNPYVSAVTKLSKAGASVPLLRTQEHFKDEGLAIARYVSLSKLQGTHALNETDIPEAARATDAAQAWGMVIDLGKCTGCNACVVACQAENNIAVVGAEGVRRNRAMHWLRLDRYFDETHERPLTIVQPVLCQQCENAPCESVCPVGATSHSPEGLNDMTYNRCVGSRYCAANCPFKIRHFNYLEYWKDVPPTYRMQLNPDVTVRSRGVMEKCTFCVQRINKAKIAHKRIDSGTIVDGEITTACEQACPTRAIAFGNLRDASSRVSKGAASPRSYRLLDELEVKPRVFYLTKVTNPNPDLEG